MATHAHAPSDRALAERSDAQYAFVAGLYVAALLVPAAVLAMTRYVDGAAALYVGYLAAVVALTGVAGLAVSRIPGIAVWLGRRDAVWVLVALPFGWFAGAYGTAAVGVDPPDVLLPPAVVSTAGGMLLGLMLVAMSRTRHADATLAGIVEHAAWEARWPRRWRLVAGAVAAVAFGASTLGILAAVVGGAGWGWRLYYLLFVAIPVSMLLNQRTFRVTGAGLVIEHPLQRQFRPWSAYTGYELTDDALVVRSAAWWRPDHRSDRADVDDVEAAVGALGAELG